MPDPATLLGAALAIFAAAFVQGVTGFAHALLAIGFLSLLYGSSDAVLILSLLAPVIAVAYFVKVRKEVVWKEALAIALPLCLLGLPLGILAFSVLREYESVLTMTVGALLVVFAGYFLTPWAPRPRDLHLAVGAGAGFLGGFLGGLASTGGPPVVLYLYARDMPKVRRMAVLQAVFVIGSIVKVLMLLPTGLVTERVTINSALLTVPLLAGVLLGQWLFTKIPAEPLRKISLALLVVLGVLLLVWTPTA